MQIHDYGMWVSLEKANQPIQYIPYEDFTEELFKELLDKMPAHCFVRVIEGGGSLPRIDRINMMVQKFRAKDIDVVYIYASTIVGFER